MPNLRELVDGINEQLDYDPDTAAYKNSVVRRINDEQVEVCNAEEDWSFMQVEVDLTLYPSLEYVDGGTTTIAYDNSVTANPRHLTLVNGAIGTHHLGATIVDSSGNRYRIDRVVDANHVFVDTPWQLTVNVQYDEFTIDTSEVLLPAECEDVLGVVDRDGQKQKILFVSRERDEDAVLDRTSAGLVLTYTPSDVRRVRAPHMPPVLVAGAAGNLRISTKYEYFYVFEAGGVRSGSSPKASVTLSAAQNSVTVAMEDTRWDPGPGVQSTGINRVVYRRDVTNNSPWIKVATDTTGIAATVVNDDTLVPDGFDYTGLTTYVETGWQRTIRVWEPPSESVTVRLRYLRRVPNLVGDTDVPILPTPYHHYLKWRVLAGIYDDLGRTSSWGARATQLLGKMRNRHLPTRDEELVMGSWAPVRRRLRRYSEVSKS
jgi:hypothetical protein